MKRRPRRTAFELAARPFGLCRFGLFLADLHRDGVEALGIDVAIDELDHGDSGVVAVAIAGLEDAEVATVPLLVARADGLEELAHLVLIAHLRDGLAASVEIAALAQ